MLVLTSSQQCALAISIVDKKGNPATVDGVPRWSVSDPAVLKVTTVADGMSADVKAVGPIGTGQVSVIADADLGAGVMELAGILDVQVIGGQAVAVTIGAGTPTEQP